MQTVALICHFTSCVSLRMKRRLSFFLILFILYSFEKSRISFSFEFEFIIFWMFWTCNWLWSCIIFHNISISFFFGESIRLNYCWIKAVDLFRWMLILRISYWIVDSAFNSICLKTKNWVKSLFLSLSFLSLIKSTICIFPYKLTVDWIDQIITLNVHLQLI